MRTYTPEEFAVKINKCTRTLIRWEKKGLLIPCRTFTGHKYYTYEQYVDYCIKGGVPISSIDAEETDGSDKTCDTEETTEGDLMQPMLNLANRVREDDAVRLTELEGDIIENRSRSMDLFFSHNNMLIVFGYLGSDLVWFSFTSLSDAFLSRRIFDCMKFGTFYRKVTMDTALSAAGMRKQDLLSMCSAHVSNVERDRPVFTGCIVNSDSNDGAALTGVEFAQMVSVIPQKIRAYIADIGDDDDIASSLEADYQALEELYFEGEPYSEEKHQRAVAISDKWKNVDCLKMSERAIIRTLYRDVRYHRYTEAISESVDSSADSSSENSTVE